MKTHKLHLLGYRKVEIADYNELYNDETSADEILCLLFSSVPGNVPDIIAERIADKLSIDTIAMCSVLDELMEEADERLRDSSFLEDEEWVAGMNRDEGGKK